MHFKLDFSHLKSNKNSMYDKKTHKLKQKSVYLIRMDIDCVGGHHV